MLIPRTSAAQGPGDARRALVDPGLTSVPPGEGADGTNLLLLDGEPHRRLRRIVDDVVRTRQARLGSVELADGLAAALRRVEVRNGTIDLVQVLEDWVAEVALRTVGTTEPDDERLRAIVGSTAGLLDAAVDEAGRWSQTMVALAVEVERAQRRLGPVLLTEALRVAQQEGRISSGQAVFTTPVVLHGAYENPLNLLSSLAAVTLGERSPRGAQTIDDLIDEVLRTRPPVHRLVRWSRIGHDDAGGRHDPRMVWIDLTGGGANGTDPPTPFGHGPHRCPGAGIARRMARTLVETLLQRPTPPEVVGVVDHQGPVTQGVRELLVRW